MKTICNKKGVARFLGQPLSLGTKIINNDNCCLISIRYITKFLLYNESVLNNELANQSRRIILFGPIPTLGRVNLHSPLLSKHNTLPEMVYSDVVT